MEKIQPNPSYWLGSILCLGCLLTSCRERGERPDEIPPATTKPSRAAQQAERVHVDAPTSAIVAAARGQIGKTKTYDPSYVGLKYPGGDVPIDRGVCTDVVVRALRHSVKMDLQKLVHRDMKAAFWDYPKIWGLKKPDPNIDHRRVPNLRRYFERKGYSIGVTERKEDYRPGDLVTCTVPPNRPHIMIVSDRRARDGIPLVIHNIGSGTKEEKRLFEFPLTGHYRIMRGGSNNGMHPDHQ